MDLQRGLRRDDGLRRSDRGGEVYVAYERRFDTTDAPHELYVRGFACAGSDCSTPNEIIAEEQVGPTVLFDQGMSPTMSIYSTSGGTRHLDFVLRDRTDRLAPSCGSSTVDYADASANDPLATDLDLVHIAWTPTTQLTGYFERTTSSPCADRGAPSARTFHGGLFDGDVTACWRFNDRNGGLDEIHCGEDDGTGTYTTAALPNSGGTLRQEHVSMTLDGQDRVAIHRSREGMPAEWKIRVRMVDDSGDPDIVLDSGTDVNFADLSIADNGTYAAVWEEELGAGAVDKIWSAWCDPGAVDCEDDANWDIDEVTTGESVQHAHLMTDNDRQVVVYMEDTDSIGETFRLKVKYRCADGSWSSAPDPETTPSVATWDQSVYSGRYAIGADRGANVVHIAYVEMDNFQRNTMPTDGNVRWASRSYTDCP